MPVYLLPLAAARGVETLACGARTRACRVHTRVNAVTKLGNLLANRIASLPSKRHIWIRARIPTAPPPWYIAARELLALFPSLCLPFRPARAPSGSGLLDQILKRRIHTALAMRNTRQLQPHLDPGQRARQHQLIEIAQMSDPKRAPSQLAKPRA